MTTIKLSHTTKDRLDRVRGDKESYNGIVLRLLDRHILEQGLVEGYRARAEEMKGIAAEWDGTAGDGL